MIYIGIDAALLAIPNHASSADEAENIVQRIIYWASPAFIRGMFRSVMLSDTTAILATGGYFPSGPHIEQLLKQWSLQYVYSPNDIRRSVNFVMQHACAARDAWEIEVETSTYIDSIPDLRGFQSKGDLFESAIRLVVTSYLAAQNGRQVLPIIVSGFPNVTGSVFVKVSADTGFASTKCGLTFPIQINAESLLVDSLEEMINSFTAEAIWRDGSDADQLHFAIMAKALVLMRARNPSCRPKDIPKFALGSSFYKSAAAYGATGTTGAHCDLLLESCARIVVGEPKNHIGTLDARTRGKKPVPITRSRDGAIAHRTHLTKSHEASRLMFWELSDGSFEFANVGPKSELDIDHGEQQETTHSGSCWGN